MILNKVNFKHELQQDNIFPPVEVQPLRNLTGYPCRRGLTRAIISRGEIVNVVSDSYSLLENENFFNEVEVQLINADINYIQRTINRENRSFAADYILSDDSFHINIKNGMDKIRPMLRFTNSYDGSCRTSGYFGFFREVCSNGLHVAKTDFGFSVKHKGDIARVVIPEIRAIIKKFIDNEYYTLQRKFEVLAETPIVSIENYIRITAEEFNLFQYETSEKNPAPSMNARIVADSIKREANLLGTQPNYWLGYNAFNELLHGKLKKTFDNQRSLDAKLFAHTLEMAN
jgi:hypothetical protein